MQIELFTIEDIRALEDLIPETLEEPHDGLLVEIEHLDLEALAGELHGIMDPIGQLQDWLYDRLQELTSWFSATVESVFTNIWELTIKPFLDTMSSTIDSIWNYIQQVPGTVTGLLGWLEDSISSVWDWIQENVLDPLTSALNSMITTVSEGFDSISKFFTETLPSYFAQIPDMISEAVSGAWDWIQNNIIDPLTQAFNTLSTLASQVAAAIQGIPSLIQDALASAWKWIQDYVLTPLSGAISTILDRISEIPELIAQIPSAIQDALSGAWEWIQENIINPLASASGVLVDYISKGVETLSEFLTEDLPGIIESIGETLQELPEKVWEKLKVAGMTIWDYITGLGKQISEGFSALGSAMETVSKYLNQVGVYLTGFINTVGELPEKLYEKLKELFEPITKGFENIGNLFGKIWESLQEFTEDPWGFLRENIFEPVWSGLQWLGEKAWEGLETVGKIVVEGAKGLFEYASGLAKGAIEGILAAGRKVAEFLREIFSKVFTEVLIKPLQNIVDKVAKSWFTVFGVKEVKGRPGAPSLMFDVAWRFLEAYWSSTLVLYLLTSLTKALSNFEIDVKPEVAGTGVGGVEWKLNLSEIANALVQGIKDFLPSFLIGSFVGIGSTLMRPVEYSYRARFISDYDSYVEEMYADVLKEELNKGAVVNMFVETPGLNEIKTWVRRHLVLTGGLAERKKLEPILATMRAHLKLFGLPKWYIDYLSDAGEKLYYKFKDRFGMERTLLLSTIFELPTHSEMARMTQRDVFPGVDVMKRLGWVRGWNEDLTTLIYLMTFKYPSFEKLWKFYMRATAGMLWFKPPDVIQQLFTSYKHLL